MIGRRGALGLLASGAASLLSGCGRRSSSLRYRLTLEVRTPHGLKTGSSVLENRLDGPFIIPLPGDIGSAVTLGEAPTADLGDGRFLFALLCDPDYRRDFVTIVLRVLSYRELQLPIENNMERMDKAAETRPFGVLRREDYPMLVTFADVNEPKSVAEVSPDDLAASFGAGHALERITFQVVDGRTPRTTGIEQRLTWLGPLYGARLDQVARSDNDRSLARRLFVGCFISGRANATA